MSKTDKLIERFLSIPKDLEWSEFVKVLSSFGFEVYSKGITGGSRRCFINKKGLKMYFHEPHPSKIVKLYMIRQSIEFLKKEGLL